MFAAPSTNDIPRPCSVFISSYQASPVAVLTLQSRAPGPPQKSNTWKSQSAQVHSHSSVYETLAGILGYSLQVNSKFGRFKEATSEMA